MFARNLLFKILGCLLVLGVSTPTSAQDANNVNELSEQLAALQIMNDTVGPMLTQANTRNRQMLQYIGTKKMQSDWSSYQKKATAPANLSFADGYKIALQRVKTEQPVTSNTASASDLSRNISATKSMVEAEWKSYNTANANAKQMSAFLESKDSLTDYESWSKTYSQKRAADHAARAQAENEKDADAARCTSRVWPIPAATSWSATRAASSPTRTSTPIWTRRPNPSTSTPRTNPSARDPDMAVRTGPVTTTAHGTAVTPTPITTSGASPEITRTAIPPTSEPLRPTITPVHWKAAPGA
jgi:hypothetical protein